MLGGLATALLVPLFLAAAATVAYAGGRLSRLATALTERTRLGSAFVGMLFLGGATSLPEIVTTASATVSRAEDLAIGNLVGGVAALLAILAVSDLAGPGALPVAARLRPLLWQCGAVAAHLGLVLGGLLLPGPTVLGMGAWSLGLLAAYPLAIASARRFAHPDDLQASSVEGRIAPRAVAAVAAILVAGVALVLATEELAARFRLDASLAGATMVAWTTSLPELSSAWAAMRLGRADLAVANIVGASLLQMLLVAGVDLGVPGPPVLGQAGGSILGLTLLGMGLVALLAAGALWRRQPAPLRAGITSWATLACYVGGLVLLSVA